MLPRGGDLVGELSVEPAGYVSSVTFDWPPNNYVNPERLSELADALEKLDDDPACRVIILQSSGRVFCAGADLGDLRPDRAGASADWDLPTTNPLYVQAVRLHATKKPIVVAVHGAAVGAGLGLALIGDFRVASAEAWFSANFVKLGFHPGFGLTHTLPRLIGRQRAAGMLLTGARVDAGKALEYGLVDKLATAESLRREASAIASEVAGNAPLAVQATRATLRGDLASAIRRQTGLEWDEQSRLMRTADFAQGVRAKVERRSPTFNGH
jgi:enoyl-CoA hydratase/carnithine racemase